MVRVILPPSLDDSLHSGHSRECLDLDIQHYPDLFAQIKTVAAKALALLEADNVMEKDMSLAVLAEKLTSIGPNTGVSSYGHLLSRMMRLKSLFAISPLSDSEKTAIWQPIAECYASVMNALSERITPLEERELLWFGAIFTAPVTFTKVCSKRGFIANVELPRFKFAAEFRRTTGRYPLKGASFFDYYLNGLPAESLNSKFTTSPPSKSLLAIAEFTIELPLQIMHALSPDGYAYVEIRPGALEQALAA